ncbi:tRNA (adenosine(37)-N6)-threonylcarbamoyltransferase complex ATPase subunit type 1 TsaE [Saccharibacillus sp. CPCC 101409]|uniref:tRNA (adenosine(37)-N6)-threonylcarbamoyltransferase complex ATPase subunit type 1 TsaE n=1 Tax=Saccharibacillus sp. CPCC 101409 TaxID=3058041 RepID=UPI0026717FAA|nr:tRNA (adenosine(37)-N6)-threonylcarbamoyltransferase complex ATPase subunit type 1 TsaE [Saccharibacillus sp. CPCC 101409]MDO3408583.1 tRNA (adenosine(37)-N6)-threonylcarbamoyltransferase complex ATPase subunit type 1 TsaE [Saccharibacillus sp. CPCC 101409]
MEWVSRSESDTERLARHFAGLAQPGTVIALDGDLGAGKTKFSQGFAAALGVPGVVNSPTFTLIKEYEGRIPFYHMDVYRITQGEADELGLDEYFEGEGVCIVEWASIIADLLPGSRLGLYIESLDADSRKFRCEGIGEPYAGWIEQWKYSK